MTTGENLLPSPHREYVDALNVAEQATKVMRVRNLEDQSNLDPDSNPYDQVENAKSIASDSSIRNLLRATSQAKPQWQIQQELLQELQKFDK